MVLGFLFQISLKFRVSDIASLEILHAHFNNNISNINIKFLNIDIFRCKLSINLLICVQEHRKSVFVFPSHYTMIINVSLKFHVTFSLISVDIVNFSLNLSRYELKETNFWQNFVSENDRLGGDVLLYARTYLLYVMATGIFNSFILILHLRMQI